MTSPVRIERDGEIAVIVVDNAPVNALSHGVREGLLAAIAQVDRDSSVRAIVLHGTGRAFMAGADLRELEEPPQPPLLKDVLMRIEACDKPVVAALHGAVLGGGAEAALACHFRCATSDLQLGFPEVKLGLLPGAGGTVRLPRIVGVKSALDLMTSGTPLGLEAALAAGLVDRAAQGDIRSAALAFAREVLDRGMRIERVRDRSIPGCAEANRTAIAEYRNSLPRAARGSKAVEQILESVQAALDLPFEAALEQAQAFFQERRTSTESRALRHLFLAERGSSGGEASRSPRDTARRVARVGVVGAGTMGSGIAASLAQAGYPVVLVDTGAGALDAGLQRVHSIVDGAVKKGRLRPEEARVVAARVSGAHELGALADADLVIEAVFENLTVKQAVFEQLGRLVKAGAVLATNTSTLDVDAIAAASGRPADVVGMHFFSPAHVMRLVEIVRAKESAADAIATTVAVTRRLGKAAVVVGNAFGFVGNRMLYAYGREKELMMLEGAEPWRIDRALEEFGMAMGPNAVGDLAGLDIGVSARRAWKDRPADPRFYRVSDLLFEHGRLGQKGGAGFYRYTGPERRRENDPQVAALIREEAGRLGVAQRDIADEEIVERCVYALINEGARLLEEGIARSAADIDVIWCNGYGFPKSRGGPMFHADTVGLPIVLSAVERYRRTLGPLYWSPAPLLERLAGSGGSLAGYRGLAPPAA
ncbi:MAG TPA: 3-hydroxyacyl-CoA dehydrogenase NAD-binding domain-containing protein [Steroidobacteraceae bacterium]|nr:3-hydroxyacyl-CoA dehydrogenase NAD-binding domain-containing protein [Steroidobacteraceae bacterium]